MKFQPGQSGNPAGRPPGSLNKKTLAAQAMFEEHAEEIAQNLMDRAKNGEPTAMRLCMDRMAPTGLNRRIAINLPMVKTPEDAEAAVTVVLTEFADGKLSINEFSALITAVDRMVRLAERIWNSARNRRYAAVRDAILLRDAEQLFQDRPQAQTGTPDAPATPATPAKPQAPLYSPVNSRTAAASEGSPAALGPDGARAPGAAKEEWPLPRAA
jgi:Family of unknown function (DUF5681)